MLVIIVLALAVLLVVAFFAFSGAYYARLFSETHFREFHGALSGAIQAVTAKPQGLDAPDSAAFVTSAEVKTVVTFSPEDDGRYTLHISLSRSEGPITHSLSMRFGFFIIAMLQGNSAELTPYFTASGIRHLSFQVASPVITVQDFDTAYARYREHYQPIPFEYRDIEA